MQAVEALGEFKNLLHDIVDHLAVPVESKLRELHATIDRLLAEDVLGDAPAELAEPVAPAPADTAPADQAATA